MTKLSTLAFGLALVLGASAAVAAQTAPHNAQPNQPQASAPHGQQQAAAQQQNARKAAQDQHAATEEGHENDAAEEMANAGQENTPAAAKGANKKAAH